MDNIRRQLLTLGLRVDPTFAGDVVRRIKKGDSLYSIYTEDLPLVSKRTAEKIRKLYEQGDLDFLLNNFIDPIPLIDQLYPFTQESHEERHRREIAQEREDLTDAREWVAAVDIEGGGLSPELDGNGYYRMAVIDQLPKFDWNIRGLTSANIPPEFVLKLLSEFDELQFQRVGSQVNTYEEGEGRRQWMGDFSGIDRYVALHFLVKFTAQHAEAPYTLLERAATLRSKGVLGSDGRLQAAGVNIVRYEIWRGHDHLEAFLEATKRYYGTKRQRTRLEAEIRTILDEANH